MAKQNYLPGKGDSLFKLKPTGDVNADLAFLKSNKFEFVVAKAFKQAGDAIILPEDRRVQAKGREAVDHERR